MLICQFSFVLRTSDDIVNALIEYVSCAIGGDKVQCHDKKDDLYDLTTGPLIMDWIAGSVAFFSTIVNLNFVLQYSDIKKVVVYLVHLFKIF